MKAEGMLGQEDHEVEWLESVDLSAAQQRDPIYYEPRQITEFHRQREKGGFRCGDHWEVTRREDQAVFVAKDGKERLLPLHLAEDFNVYRAESMPVAVGERVLITKNNRKASLINGDLLEVKAIDQTGILSDTGTRDQHPLPVPSDLAAKAVDGSVQDPVARDRSLVIVADPPQDLLDFFDR